MSWISKASVLTLAAALMAPATGLATDIYRPDGWSALASDRTAAQVGDSLTVLIYETSSGANSAQRSNKAGASVGGQIITGSSSPQSGQLSGTGSLDVSGETGRSGKLVAQISVVVDGLLPNGDLHVAGEQTLNISGQRTHIRLRGRVRRADIASNNTILSSRLADASIDYDGAGFDNAGKRRARLGSILHWLGLS